MHKPDKKAGEGPTSIEPSAESQRPTIPSTAQLDGETPPDDVTVRALYTLLHDGTTNAPGAEVAMTDAEADALLASASAVLVEPEPEPEPEPPDPPIRGGRATTYDKPDDPGGGHGKPDSPPGKPDDPGHPGHGKPDKPPKPDEPDEGPPSSEVPTPPIHHPPRPTHPVPSYAPKGKKG